MKVRIGWLLKAAICDSSVNCLLYCYCPLLNLVIAGPTYIELRYAFNKLLRNHLGPPPLFWESLVQKEGDFVKIVVCPLGDLGA